MTEEKEYKPLLPEEDPKLLSNPHYWLYKVTREALDNKDKNHPLADMGHIWNRWACEGLSEEEREAIRTRDNYSVLSHDEKRKIRKEINKEIKEFGLKNIDWRFPKSDKRTNFENTTWTGKVNFERFIFREYAQFMEVNFIENANFEYVIFRQKANFCNVKFEKKLNFERAIFSKDFNFSNAEFIQDVNFKYAQFKGNANFENSAFKQRLNLSKSEFTGNKVNFYKCKFIKPFNTTLAFSFAHTIFATTVNFSESEFHHLPNLTGTDFRGGVNLDKVTFPPDFCHCESCEARRSNPENNSQESDNPRGLKLDCHSPLQGLRNDESKENYPILGGLKTYKDAAVTWHALSTEMEKAGYHDQALEYFGYELEAKRLNTQDNDRIFRGILSLYKTISDYGQSIARPFWWWLGLSFLFFYIYYCTILFYKYSFNLDVLKTYTPDIWYSLKFSFKGLFPFISDQTTFFDRMFDDEGANEYPRIIR